LHVAKAYPLEKIAILCVNHKQQTIEEYERCLPDLVEIGSIDGGGSLRIMLRDSCYKFREKIPENEF
jgi:hypothetical protein